ncbi:MAG: energy-coupling factor transporter transmembrane protein EcfT [Candidatus Heimdallarchaeota archaeon]|nr:energy-coupling factor transporter transmembrane protein EcfT [Candidatus Heimdallarchaeota archaeon]
MTTFAVIFDEQSKRFQRNTFLDPRAKGIFQLYILVSVLYSTNLYLLVSLAYLSIILAVISKVRLRHLIMSIFFLSLFSVIATALAFYTTAIEDPHTFFLIFETRFLAVYFISSWFFLTVETYELAVALEKMYIPAILVWFIIMIYQFIPVVTKEAHEINDIKKLKGLYAKKWEIKKQIYILRKTLKPLISGAINRGVDLAESMVMKGFEPKKRQIYAFNVRIRLIDFIAIVLSITALVLTIIYLRM